MGIVKSLYFNQLCQHIEPHFIFYIRQKCGSKNMWFCCILHIKWNLVFWTFTSSPIAEIHKQAYGSFWIPCMWCQCLSLITMTWINYWPNIIFYFFGMKHEQNNEVTIYHDQFQLRNRGLELSDIRLCHTPPRVLTRPPSVWYVVYTCMQWFWNAKFTAFGSNHFTK